MVKGVQLLHTLNTHSLHAHYHTHATIHTHTLPYTHYHTPTPSPYCRVTHKHSTHTHTHTHTHTQTHHTHSLTPQTYIYTHTHTFGRVGHSLQPIQQLVSHPSFKLHQTCLYCVLCTVYYKLCRVYMFHESNPFLISCTNPYSIRVAGYSICRWTANLQIGQSPDVHHLRNSFWLLNKIIQFVYTCTSCYNSLRFVDVVGV